MLKFVTPPLALAAAFATFPAPAQVPDLNDLEIAHAAYTAGGIDIRYAHLAMALSEAPAVRDFAAVMLRDHSAVNEAAGALIQDLGVTPQDNALSQALLAGAADNIDRFRTLDGAAFDCAYAENELGYHQVVNRTVSENFIPAVTVAPLRDLLAEALVTFRAHEAHAERMVAELGCDS
ncbi:MAG: DUF4142 domain-containing protein [Azospirillaceae bacterium]